MCLVALVPFAILNACSSDAKPSLLANTLEAARTSGTLAPTDAVPGTSLTSGVTIIQTAARPYPEIGPVTLVEVTDGAQTACLAQSDGNAKQVGVSFEACPDPIGLATQNGATVSRAIAETAILRYQLRSSGLNSPVDTGVMASVVAELVEEGYNVTASPIAQGKAFEFSLDGTTTCFVSGDTSFRYQEGPCPASGT